MFATHTAIAPGVITPTRPTATNPLPHGDLSTAPVDDLRAVSAAVWQTTAASREQRGRGLRYLCQHLVTFAGDTWQQRWVTSGLDTSGNPVRDRFASPATAGGAIRAAETLFSLRVVRPSVGGFFANTFIRLAQRFRVAQNDPDLNRFFDHVASSDLARHHQQVVLDDVCQAILLLGITFTDLSPEAFSFYATTMRENSGRGPSSPRNSGHLAWEWLHSAGQFPAHVPRVMRAALLPGQKSTAHLVDGYRVRNPQVRQLLIDYLQRRRQDMDYKSLRNVTALLVRLFWNKIEAINPAQSDLHLSAEVYEQWRSQIAFLDDGVTVRHDLESLLTTVRGLYFDLQAWAPAEPHLWAQWVAPCPVRMTATRAAGTRKRRIHERMADRTRRLQPLLPILSEHVEAEAERWTRLLTACDGAGADSRITVDGRDYRRDFSRRDADRERGGRPIHVRVRDEATGEVIEVSRRENTAFWHWALVETLRHSGLRIEEVLELSQLSIRQYQRGNGEIVPLLVIAPSKTDRERVIPMSVDLFHVVATIIRRHTRDQPTVPLVCQYDHRERSLSAPLPFLFQRPSEDAAKSSPAKLSCKCCTASAPTSPRPDPSSPKLTSPHTTSDGSSPPTSSTAAYPYTSAPPCSATSTCRPPAATSPSSTTTSSATTRHTSPTGGACETPPNIRTSRRRNGSSSRTTSTNARSNSARALVPTKPPADTNTPASAAPCSKSTPACSPDSTNSKPTSSFDAHAPKPNIGAARSKVSI